MGFKRSPQTAETVASRAARDDEIAAIRRALVKKGVVTDQEIDREKPPRTSPPASGPNRR